MPVALKLKKITQKQRDIVQELVEEFIQAESYQVTELESACGDYVITRMPKDIDLQRGT